MSQINLNERLNRFVEITCRLVGQDAPKEFLNGKCDLSQRWDKNNRAKSELNKNFASSANEFKIGHSEFNQLMLLFGMEPVSHWFFTEILGSTLSSLEDYDQKVNTFRVKAALKFGNFKYAFRFFAGIKLPPAEAGLSLSSDPASVWAQLNRSSEEIKKSLINRLPRPLNVTKIPLEQRHFVSEIHRRKEGDADYAQYLEVSEIAKFNTAVYLSSDFIDVYVATSMRTVKNFRDVAQTIDIVFGEESLNDLNLRYFDPTLSDGTGRISKGLIEALMLKRCKVTLYLAQEADSLGKDSELATTLAQGKDVIVLVPDIDEVKRKAEIATRLADSVTQLDEIEYLHTIASKSLFKPGDFQSLAREVCTASSSSELGKLSFLAQKAGEIAKMEKAYYDGRAKLLREIHPLGLQVNLQSGVANGVIVVRTIPEAAEMISRSILNSHEYQIDFCDKEYVYKLNELRSGSTVRVVSDDKFLSKAFWANYLEFSDAKGEILTRLVNRSA